MTRASLGVESPPFSSSVDRPGVSQVCDSLLSSSWIRLGRRVLIVVSKLACLGSSHPTLAVVPGTCFSGSLPSLKSFLFQAEPVAKVHRLVSCLAPERLFRQAGLFDKASSVWPLVQSVFKLCPSPVEDMDNFRQSMKYELELEKDTGTDGEGICALRRYRLHGRCCFQIREILGSIVSSFAGSEESTLT